MKKYLRFFLVLTLITSWVFSGFPQIFITLPGGENIAFPSAVPKAFAATETIRPNSTGTYQEWDLVGGSTHDGATSDQSDSTYLETGVDEERDTQALADTTFDAGDTIGQIEVFVTCKAPGGGGPREKAGILIREGGTDTENGSKNIDRNNFTDTSVVYITNPRTSSAWTKSEIDALEAGVRLKTIGNGETVQCSEIRVVITHTTSSAAPTVTTQTASSVTQTTATLNGNITDTGGINPTDRGFAWGTNSSLSGGDTATTTESGSFGTGAFTDTSLTLVCNTTYYSRAYATNSNGTGLGGISASFTTSACSATTILVSGTLYSDEGSTALDGGSITVNLAVSTSTVGLYSTTTDSGSGVWKIENISTTDFGVGTPFIVWIDGDTNTRAYALTKASSTADGSNITGFDLYQNRVIVKHEATSGTSTTNADLAFYDNDNNTSIQFTSVAGGALNTFKDQELHIWTGDTFAPGGTVTTHGNASTSPATANPDGSLHIDNNATFTAGGAITVGGNWDADTGSTFTHGGNAVTFNASTTGKTIAGELIGADTFDNVTFNDSSGAWTFSNNASTTDFTITNGTVNISGRLITLAGSLSNSGTLTTDATSVLYFTGTSKTLSGTLTETSQLRNIEFLNSGSWTFDNNASTTDLIITSGTVTAPTLLTVAGDYTNNGTFAAGSGTIYFTGSSKTYSGTMTGTSAFATTTFTGSGLKTLGANASSTNITIENSAQLVAPTLLSVSGDYTNNASFSDVGGTVLFDGTNQTITGTLNTATTDFANVIFANSGTKTISVNASTTGFTIDSGVTVVAPTLLTIGGNYTNDGDFTDGGGSNTVYFNGTVTLAGQMTGSVDDFNIIEFVGAGTKTFNANASTTDFTVTAGTVDISGQLITITGNLSNSGVFTTDGTSKLYFTGTSKTLSGTLIGTSQLRDVEFLNSGSWSFSNNASTTALTITTGTLTAPSGLLSIAGNYTNNGTFSNNAGTTTFNGTAVQSLSGTLVGGSAFYNIEILNTSATTTFSSAASTTNNFYAVQPNSRIEFANAATSTLVNFTITGTSGNEIYLHSDSSGTQWNIHSTGTRAVTYANIKDSDACSAAGTIDVTDGTSIDGTNNDCWDFPISGDPTISSAANQVFEIGQAITSISVITVTDNASPSITAANDLRIAIATSSVDMRWDTDDTTPLFGGTASTTNKIATAVTYEGGGSVMVIDVTTDFSGSDTLTIDGLSFVDFNATNAAISALDIFKDGSADFTSDADDDKTVAISGALTESDHDSGQEANKFDISNSATTSAELFAFKLTPTGENVSITSLVFSLSAIKGFVTGNITNATTTIDYNNNGAIDAGEDEVGGTGVVSISGTTGTITFSTSFTATTTRNYILKADVTNIDPGDRITVSLSSSGITSSGSDTGESITPSGSATAIQHTRPPGAGGGGGAGGGAGQQTGGGESGGETIGDEPGFLPPTANASVGSYTQWTTPSNANSSDGLYATLTGVGANDFYNFSFTVPAGNTINGIQVKLEASASSAAGTIDAALSVDGGSSTSTPVKSTNTLSTTDTIYTLGSASDMWGLDWSNPDTKTNNSNFRLRLIGQPSSNTISLDAIQVKVFHQAGGGGSGGGGAVYKPIIHNLANTLDVLDEIIEFISNLFSSR